MTTPDHIAATIARCREVVAKIQAPPSPASALTRWQQLKQHLLALGYSATNADEKIEQLAPGLWEQATLEVNRGTPASATRKAAEPPHERSDTPMTATEEFTQRRDAYQRAHNCTSLEASDAINKEAPDLWQRHLREDPQRVPVRHDVQHIAVRPATAGQQDLDILKTAARARHPQWTEQQIDKAVESTPAGQDALRRHRQEHLFGRKD